MPDDVLALATDLRVLVRRNLPREGPSASQVDGLLRRGRLVSLHRGVLLPSGGLQAAEHTWLVALIAGGADAVLTGELACHLHGLRRARRDAAPLALSLRSRTHLRAGLVRTDRLPQRLHAAADGRAWPVAPLPRALADAVRRLDDERARALVGEALSTGRMLPRQLVHELTAGRRRSGATTTVLADLGAGGIWSVPEGDLLDLVRTSCVLPVPQMNALLLDTRTRKPVVRPDALWLGLAMCGSVDSRENHADGEQWADTLDKALTSELRGLLHVHVTPAGLSRRPQEVLLVFERHGVLRWGSPPPEGLEVVRDVPPPLRRR